MPRHYCSAGRRIFQLWQKSAAVKRVGRGGGVSDTLTKKPSEGVVLYLAVEVVFVLFLEAVLSEVYVRETCLNDAAKRKS